MRSALGGKAPLPYIDRVEDIQQRASVILTNVHYVIESHFDMTDDALENDSPGKFRDIFMRRLKRGQCYSQPYFGTREFPANFKEWPNDQEIHGYYSNSGTRDLGLMLYDIDYSNPDNFTPMFFKAKLLNGILDVAGSEVYR
jgi:CRISPR-associated protein Cas5d